MGGTQERIETSYCYRLLIDIKYCMGRDKWTILSSVVQARSKRHLVCTSASMPFA